jgi:hypothetical protein
MVHYQPCITLFKKPTSGNELETSDLLCEVIHLAVEIVSDLVCYSENQYVTGRKTTKHIANKMSQFNSGAMDGHRSKTVTNQGFHRSLKRHPDSMNVILPCTLQVIASTICETRLSSHSTVLGTWEIQRLADYDSRMQIVSQATTELTNVKWMSFNSRSHTL